YDSTFGSRMRGEGQFAELFEKRFEIARKRAGFDLGRDHGRLDTSRFQRPAGPTAGSGAQGSLF
ncbi:MAG TPA: radical SAM protein, partial [Casimicrobiaceae bacterium]|nr:radical SAM protein [Casimicrobiaceae bacterium]